MKRPVVVFTGTRAEYGLLRPLMARIRASGSMALQILVSGMHLAPEFGSTWRELRDDGFEPDAKVEMLLSSDTPVGVVKSMGVGLLGFAEALDRLRPSALVILGDRFEALAAAQAALVLRIPIAHLHGGEITEGAYDDSFRHAITKMAALHFVAAAPYRDRVIQMGEQPESVFDVGAIGIDSLVQASVLDPAHLGQELGFPLRQPFFLVTYHPATLSTEDPEATFHNLISALDRFPDHQVILTHPNADDGARRIRHQIDAYVARAPERLCAVPSLGQRRYISALAHASAVVGNSSSGIIEAPSLGVPTINIGGRQSGRLAAASVLHCGTDAEAIHGAIEASMAPHFRTQCARRINPYGRGDASRQIVEILEERLPLKVGKRFHDIRSYQ